LEHAGLSDPLSKIYITTEGLIENFALLCFLMIIQQVQKYQYNERLGIFEGTYLFSSMKRLTSIHLKHELALPINVYVYFLKVFWFLETQRRV
jgi:hypothetical protein